MSSCCMSVLYSVTLNVAMLGAFMLAAVMLYDVLWSVVASRMSTKRYDGRNCIIVQIK
jgi:hypothetical protein